MNPTRTLDAVDLEQRVQQMYTDVARHPQRGYHFETGRCLAERLGYPASAMQTDAYRALITGARLHIETVRANDNYRFLSASAANATDGGA